MKPLRAEFDLTRDDLAAAADVAADRDPGVQMARRRAQRTLAVLILVLVAYQALALAEAGPGASPANVAISGVVVLFLVWICPTRRTMRRTVRKQFDAKFSTP